MNHHENTKGTEATVNYNIDPARIQQLQHRWDDALAEIAGGYMDIRAIIR